MDRCAACCNKIMLKMALNTMQSMIKSIWQQGERNISHQHRYHLFGFLINLNIQHVEVSNKVTVCKNTRVSRGPVVKCLTCNPGILGSSHTGSAGFFRGSVLGQDTSEPSLVHVLVKLRKDMNNVSYPCDMTEILLKLA